MRKLKLFIAALALIGGVSTVNAQVYIETDLTSDFNSLATTQWQGSTGQVGWAAPQVTTNSGLTVAAWERYNNGCNWTGDIMYTTVTGLVPGTYTIELYGAAAFTFGRGFGSTHFTGDFSVDHNDAYAENDNISENTGVVLYATTAEGTVEKEIPIWYATNFNAHGLSTAKLEGVVVGEEGTIKIGLSKTSTSTNWHVVQLKGVIATVDAITTFATYKAEAEGLYDSPMNGTVLSDLKAAANVDLSAAGADEYKAAIEALVAKINAAKESIANYEKAKAILDAANGLDEDGQEAYLADEAVVALKTAYDNRTLVAVTAEQESACTTALVNATKAQTTDGSDWTTAIVNPSFETGNLTGWTNNGMQTQNNTSFAKVGTWYCEAWQPNGTKSVKQAMTNMPAGTYSLSAKALARGVTSAKLFAAGEETAITVSENPDTYTVEFTFDGNGDLTIGFEGVGTGAGSSWLCVDNFTLTYVEAPGLEDLIEALALAITEAEKYESLIPEAAWDELLSVIEENDVDFETVEEYETAIQAINEAVEKVKPLVEPYDEWKEMKANMESLKDQTSYTGASAKTNFENAIEEAEEAVEESTTADAIVAEMVDLLAAAKVFVNNITVKDGEVLEITALIQNPHFTRGEGGKSIPTGWTLESGAITEHRLLTHNFESWHNRFNLSQTITDLPKGTYRVTLQGFARHDNASITDKTNLYCGIKDQPIKNIKAEYSTTSFYDNSKEPLGDTNRDTSYTLDGQTVYQPNGMTGAYYWFQETNPETGQPFYTNEVQTLIEEDGDLKIGFKCETGEDWVIWDNFHLYYYGSEISVVLHEDEGGSFSEPINDAKVTLTKTLYEGYNTLVVPFDMSTNDYNGQLGLNIKLYKYNDVLDGMLYFNQIIDGAIEANVPYLLYVYNHEILGEPLTITLTGRNIEVGTPVTEGTSYDFVGVYGETTVADGDYILGESAFLRSSGGNKVPAYRAYLMRKEAAPEGEARLQIVVDGVTTAIDTIDGQPVNSDAIFNLSGQQVNRAQKGIYIQNGKKVVIK